MNDHLGITGQPAPELTVDDWFADGASVPAVRLADIDEPFVYLYFFQSWCPGCHSSGFPTVRAVRDALARRGLGDRMRFVSVQTVFEGHDTNTADAAVESLGRHGLEDLVVGHDSGTPPRTMTDYRTGGTPWTVLVGPDRTVLADGFHHDPDKLVALVERHESDHTDRSPEEDPAMTDTTDPRPSEHPSDAELRERLTAEQYHVTQEAGTEPAFTGEYWDVEDPGVYRCVVCDTELFDSDHKFDSGTGWPSFDREITEGRVDRIEDQSHGMVRVEARCASCDAHLGHVFPDGPATTGDRYCMNSASLSLDRRAAE